MGFTEPDTPPPPQGVPQMPVSAFDIQAPYEPGSPDPIDCGDGPHPARPGCDDVAGTVAAAVAASMAWRETRAAETYAQGSTIGELLTLPDPPGIHSKHAGGDDTGYPS